MAALPGTGPRALVPHLITPNSREVRVYRLHRSYVRDEEAGLRAAKQAVRGHSQRESTSLEANLGGFASQFHAVKRLGYDISPLCRMEMPAQAGGGSPRTFLSFWHQLQA